jgi:putative DNA methylase
MSEIKKLIEVALPLKEINFQAAREKSIRHGHPSTLHLWWARRPLAACRAVLFASLVDDPSSHTDKFPTPEAQAEERKRLFKIIEDLVDWDNIGNEDLYKRAYQEILASTNGNPPPVLDPFAGGGSIPLEAQRLGLEAHASDLNPVAVLINKALIEIPSRFKDRAPVNPRYRSEVGDRPLKGAGALAEDVKYYGEWMRQKAFEKIGHLYPKVKVPATDTEHEYEATVIAWIWARTVKCPNPACGAEMPLVHSFELSKKKGKETWINLVTSADRKTVTFEIKKGKGKIPEGTVNRNGAKCPCCGEPVGFPYIRDEGKAGRMGAKMMAIVADGHGGRVYLPANDAHIKTADVPKPEDYPEQPLPEKALGFRIQQYGMTKYADLFTSRQLTALTTFSNLVGEAIKQVEEDTKGSADYADLRGLEEGGTGARAYAEAVGVYLAFILDKLLDRCTTISAWDSGYYKIRNTFGRQAIPMTWDYAEGNPFSSSTGCWESCTEWQVKYLQKATPNAKGIVNQQDASTITASNSIVISTDPPYYDNIGYADLSDFFYIWLRRSLKAIYTALFKTLLTPKIEELIANPFRFTRKEEAKLFFENGMLQAFSQMKKSVNNEYPLTVYYAFKQTESEESEKSQKNNSNSASPSVNTSSTGWETMLQAIIKAGFLINGTWPMRTEMSSRMRSIDSNALASSIALVCRPRPDNAPSITRRDFIPELRSALKQGLSELQSGNIAPVDLAQASIGPGMAVCSKYKEILEADGNNMTVHSALVLINNELDVLLGEEGSLDAESRFCIFWYEQFGLNKGKSGDADQLARSKSASLDNLRKANVFEYEHGIARLKRREELSAEWNPQGEKVIWTIVQQLCKTLESSDPETGGIKGAAAQIAALGSKADDAKALAYRAFRASEKLSLSEEAQSYNQLAAVWGDILKEADNYKKTGKNKEQQELEF